MRTCSMNGICISTSAACAALCAVSCPLGIDTAQVTLAAREILAGLGMAPRPTVRSALGIYRWGNSWGLPPGGWRSRRPWKLNSGLLALTGQAMRCPGG